MKRFLLRKTLIHAFYQNSVSERIEDLHQEQNLQLKLHLHVREKNNEDHIFNQFIFNIF